MDRYAVGFAVLALGLLALGTALRGRRIATTAPLCPRCHYEVSAEYAVCPECGRQLWDWTSMRRSVRRVRRRLAAAGAILVVIGAIILASPSAFRRFVGSAPAGVLVEAAHWFQSPPILEELQARQLGGTLSPHAQDRLFAFAIEHPSVLTKPVLRSLLYGAPQRADSFAASVLAAQIDDAAEWNEEHADLFEELASSGQLSEQRIRTYFAQAWRPTLVVQAVGSVPETANVPIVAIGTPRLGSGSLLTAVPLSEEQAMFRGASLTKAVLDRTMSQAVVGHTFIGTAETEQLATFAVTGRIAADGRWVVEVGPMRLPTWPLISNASQVQRVGRREAQVEAAIRSSTYLALSSTTGTVWDLLRFVMIPSGATVTCDTRASLLPANTPIGSEWDRITGTIVVCEGEHVRSGSVIATTRLLISGVCSDAIRYDVEQGYLTPGEPRQVTRTDAKPGQRGDLLRLRLIGVIDGPFGRYVTTSNERTIELLVR